MQFSIIIQRENFDGKGKETKSLSKRGWVQREKVSKLTYTSSYPHVHIPQTKLRIKHLERYPTSSSGVAASAAGATPPKDPLQLDF